ncbi:MAG: ABC transporter ATP-binding protein [Deltaproteobacteria bacterium]|nr:ABC transporter ATP-binding protein [Deltaproteobacteria bacterium]
MSTPPPILAIRDLQVAIDAEGCSWNAVDGLTLTVQRGRTLALVGESGSGKTLTALAVLGLLPSPPSRLVGGAIEFLGRDLTRLKDAQMRKIRGDRIAMIFQEPATSLNPLVPVGRQIAEAMRVHQGIGEATAREQVLALMEIVGIPDPRPRYRSYPHQLSGGMRQRIIIAMALSCRPDLLLADEPTTALDATVQAQIVDLLSRLIKDLRMSVILITHDLAVVAAMADRVAVLYAGRLMEEGGVREVLKDPLHPYTRALVAASPTGVRRSGQVVLPLQGGLDSGARPENACLFAPRCPHAFAPCATEAPPLALRVDGRLARCHLPEVGHG